jgi:hypothetical protein
MTEAATQLRVPPPLPDTRRDLLASRAMKRQRTILDHVEDVFVVLWEDQAFKKLNEAVFHSQAVHGNTHIDDVFAGIVIKDKAKDLQMVELMDEPMDAIVHALRLVRNRYRLGRPYRKDQSRVVITTPTESEETDNGS